MAETWSWFYEPPKLAPKPVAPAKPEEDDSLVDAALAQQKQVGTGSVVQRHMGSPDGGGYGYGFNSTGQPAIDDGTPVADYTMFENPVAAVFEHGLPSFLADIGMGSELSDASIGDAAAADAAGNAAAAAAMDADYGIGLDAFGGVGEDVSGIGDGGGGDGGGGDSTYICTRANSAKRLSTRDVAVLRRLRRWTARHRPDLVAEYDRRGPAAVARLPEDHPVWETAGPALGHIARLVSLDRYADALRDYIVVAGVVADAAESA